ncbi:MAG: hypothetical protein IPG80_03370 [Anaerolineales bacterium]|uniref:hypothetical protein n=1 Tax=Candidatus Villigracilis vicinus TaxID=3140679 RepID=UPI003135A876|nr:hypothetical protein [Anaerolineales bacterium]
MKKFISALVAFTFVISAAIFFVKMNVDERIEVIIEKDASWCDGKEWQVWLAHNDYYEDEEVFDLEVSDPDDADKLEGKIKLVDGEYCLQGWCDSDSDGNVWDANTWLMESTVEGVRMSFREHVRSLEIGGRAYSISTAINATPDAGACTRPSSSDFNLICNIDL